MDNGHDQLRQLKIPAHKHNEKNVHVLCPFCDTDNRIGRCKHFLELREPKYKSGTTGDAIGNYVYMFKRQGKEL